MENKNVVVSHGNFAPPGMEFFCSLNIFKKKKETDTPQKKKKSERAKGGLFFLFALKLFRINLTIESFRIFMPQRLFYMYE